MKTSKNIRILILALLFAAAVSPLAAQHYVGVVGGYGFGSARFNPARETGWEPGLMSGGVLWRYYSPTPFVGAIGAELKYAGRGYRLLPSPKQAGEEEVNPNDSTYIRRLSSIELPFIWQPHVYVFNKNMRVFLNLGLYLTFHFDSSEKKLDYLGEVEYDRPYDMRIVRDNFFGYGLLGGFGMSYLYKRYEIFTEARYTYGYSDILKTSTKYPPNNVVQTPMDGFNIYLGVSYRLGKGGIRSPQGIRKLSDSKKIKNGNDGEHAPAEDRQADTEGY